MSAISAPRPNTDAPASAELLTIEKSPPPVADAVFVTNGIACGSTLTASVKPALSPIAIDAAYVAVTIWPMAAIVHPVPVALTNVSPVGSVSRTGHRARRSRACRRSSP
jgi:hypothetical protein